MTDIKRAIDRIIDTRDYKYSHFGFTDDTGKAFDLAIRSLQAWSEVLEELEELKKTAEEMRNYTLYKACEMAIDIINKHLADQKGEEE